jgi:hypothetical protein
MSHVTEKSDVQYQFLESGLNDQLTKLKRRPAGSPLRKFPVKLNRPPAAMPDPLSALASD